MTACTGPAHACGGLQRCRLSDVRWRRNTLCAYPCTLPTCNVYSDRNKYIPSTASSIFGMLHSERVHHCFTLFQVVQPCSPSAV